MSISLLQNWTPACFLHTFPTMLGHQHFSKKNHWRMPNVASSKCSDKFRAETPPHPCKDVVDWAQPMQRQSMIRYVKAADFILEQMALLYFGITASKVLIAKRNCLTKWFSKFNNLLSLIAFSEQVISRNVALNKLGRDKIHSNVWSCINLVL